MANTLVRQPDGTIFADNTDVLGFSWLLERFCQRELGASAIETLSGRRVCVLGSGGASMPNEGSYETALRRSAEIQADLPDHPERYTMVSTSASICVG